MIENAIERAEQAETPAEATLLYALLMLGDHNCLGKVQETIIEKWGLISFREIKRKAWEIVALSRPESIEGTHAVYHSEEGILATGESQADAVSNASEKVNELYGQDPGTYRHVHVLRITPEALEMHRKTEPGHVLRLAFDNEKKLWAPSSIEPRIG
jgi:hypothetical protein